MKGGLTYTQTFRQAQCNAFDAENRLISVTVNPSGQTTQFIYDGDGNLVKKINPDNSKTIYAGGVYEVNKNASGTVTGTTIYYPAGGAMRVNGTLYFVLKDHLGSASVVTDENGDVVGEQRYYAFGETRLTSGSMFTDKLFTGQRAMADLGIYHYGARFYSPKLGRFLSADTIVPNAFNPQDLNRYSYVRNNPVRYVDPSGNIPIDCYGTSYCGTTKSKLLPEPYKPPVKSKPKGWGGGGGGLVITVAPSLPDPSSDDPIVNIVLNEPGSGNGGGVTCGQPAVYSPDCPNWHEYTAETVVCPAIFDCTEAEMIDYMSRFAYPNQDPSSPAQRLGQYTVGIPIVGLDLDGMGPIIFTTSNGGLTTTNTTLRPHILYDGVVNRTATQNANGDWVVVTEGYGNNVNPGMDVANNIGGPILFNTVDVQMFLYIATDQIFGP